MPYYKRRGRRTNPNRPRRRYRRRPRRYRNRATQTRYTKVSAPGYMVSKQSIKLPLGPRLKRTLKYHECNLSLNPGIAAIPGLYTFSANGLTDPNITGIGHQPMGFDQLMMFYYHYTVIGSKIKVSFMNDDLNAYPVMVGIYMSGSNTVTATSFTALIEQGDLVWTTINSKEKDGYTVDLVQKCSVAKYLSVPSILTERNYSGTTVSNPVENVYYHIVAAPTNNVDLAALQMAVEIEYITVFHEPRELPMS